MTKGSIQSELIRIAAGSTDLQQLDTLGMMDDSSVKKAVLSNPLVTTDTLVKMAQLCFRHQMILIIDFERIINHSRFPLKDLLNYTKDINPSIVIASKKALSQRNVLDDLLDD